VMTLKPACIGFISQCKESSNLSRAILQRARQVDQSSFGELAMTKTEDIFEPRWPQGLVTRKFYEFRCDDKGRDGGSWIRVFIADDGDVHVAMQDWEQIKTEGTKPSPFPSVRCRTGVGGGRHQRTRQALLWLAKAIELDNAELGIED